jgi:2-polyprenyl-6-methoxyphenol hydroxylase-like FAD-dependent oxidoreductase
MKVLISGAGISGLTLAYWLEKSGHQVILIEKAPALRQGGYMIDFWGVGFDVAEKMGLLETLKGKHYHIPELDFVDLKGNKKGHFEIQKLRKLVNYRHFNFLRSGLEQVLYDALPKSVSVRFATQVQSIQESEHEAHIEFTDGSEESVDLVVVAEGLRSHLRRHVFGKDTAFEKYLGYYVASFTVPNTTQENGFFNVYTLPEKQIWVYDIGEGNMSVTYVFKSTTEFGRLAHDKVVELLNETFSDFGEIGETTLSLLAGATDFYFDSVSQIELPEWSKGRVAFLGDSCQCVSLISGQGSSLAMAGAYILSQELAESNGDFKQAFRRYQAKMQPEIQRKQAIARRFAKSFIPSSKLGIYSRNAFVNLMFIPLVAKYLVRKLMSDRLKI